MVSGQADPPSPLPEPVTAGSGRTGVRLELAPQGRDWVLMITGGRAHVGAVAVSHRDPGGEFTTRILAVGSHREGPLAGECAEMMARAAGATCAAVAGIHQDGATSGEIAAIVANVREAAGRLAGQLAGTGGGPDPTKENP